MVGQPLATPRPRPGRMLLFLVLALIAGPLARSADPAPSPAPASLAAALELFTARRYPEAREALARIVGAEPNHAAAHHYLGRTLTIRHDLPAIEEGLRHLARAAELEPRNAVYLGIYGGASLQHAGRTNSLLAARRGREAMEQALALDPDYLDAREGLFQFYQRAPWPLGSTAKAAAQLEEIRRRDPDLATVLTVGVRLNARDYAGAFQLCEEVLARQPRNYTALYHYGRCASISGQNLERGAREPATVPHPGTADARSPVTQPRLAPHRHSGGAAAAPQRCPRRLPCRTRAGPAQSSGLRSPGPVALTPSGLGAPGSGPASFDRAGLEPGAPRGCRRPVALGIELDLTALAGLSWRQPHHAIPALPWSHFPRRGHGAGRLHRQTRLRRSTRHRTPQRPHHHDRRHELRFRRRLRLRSSSDLDAPHGPPRVRRACASITPSCRSATACRRAT
jgi:hypothetical protein